MDNKDVIEMEESVNTKQKVTAGRVVHITAAILLLVAATVVIAFAAYCAVEFFVVRAEHNALEGTGESQLGTGIAQALMLVLYLVFAVIGVILSLISIVLSIKVFKYREGREKTFGLVSIILNGAYILTALVLFFVMILI